MKRYLLILLAALSFNSWAAFFPPSSAKYTSGTIDGVYIGEVTPAPAWFTNISATGVVTVPTPDCSNTSTVAVNAAWVVCQGFSKAGQAVAGLDQDQSIPSYAAVVNMFLLTAPRTYTLPTASAVSADHTVCIVDPLGGITSVNTLTVAVNPTPGTDTINGGSSLIISNTRGSACLISNGSSRWTVPILGIEQGGTSSTTAAAARSALGVTYANMGNVPAAQSCPLGSTAPAVSAGAGAGTGPTGPTMTTNSTSCDGEVVLTTGTTPATASPIFTMTFAGSGFGTTAFCVYSPTSASAATLSGGSSTFAATSNTGSVMNSGGTALSASTQYKWAYHCGAKS